MILGSTRAAPIAAYGIREEYEYWDIIGLGSAVGNQHLSISAVDHFLGGLSSILSPF
jgi:hypothetical protein